MDPFPALRPSTPRAAIPKCPRCFFYSWWYSPVLCVCTELGLEVKGCFHPAEVQGCEWKGGVWLGEPQTLSIQLLVLSTFTTLGYVGSETGLGSSKALSRAAE